MYSDFAFRRRWLLCAMDQRKRKIMMLDECDSSDSSEDDDVSVFEDRLCRSIPPPVTLLNTILQSSDDEDGEYVEVLIGFTLQLVKRINRFKISNYLDIVHKYEEGDFITHFRLSRSVTYPLISRFEKSESFQSLKDSPGREAISAEKHILTFLWFAGHQTASYRDVADRFGISISTLHEIVSRVIKFIFTLGPEVVKLPSTHRAKKAVKDGFHEKFPGAIGAIDGTHIRIDRPHIDGDSYRNRNKYYSIHMQGLVDHNRKFMDFLVGFPGSVHDARVFRESPFYDKLDELCDVGTFILGDSAYPCLPQVMVPYRDNGHLKEHHKAFNKKLSSARVVVEHTFGILKQRFRQLYHLKLRTPVRMIEFIGACCILHNLAGEDDLKWFQPRKKSKKKRKEHKLIREEIVVLPHEISGKTLRDTLCTALCGGPGAGDDVCLAEDEEDNDEWYEYEGDSTGDEN